MANADGYFVTGPKRETARGIEQAIESLRAGKMRPYKPAAADDGYVADENNGRGGESRATSVKWLLATGLDFREFQVPSPAAYRPC